ncbi:TPA: hypothetical protein ACINR5_002080, partial [Streptococcus agalactiae]
EKGKNPKSGNFVTDTLLEDYSSYFGMDKSDLIFGDALLLELTLYHVFSQIFYQIVPDDNRIGLKIDRNKIQNNIDSSIIEPFLELFYIFGDFGRWYNIRRKDDDESDKDIDYTTMYEIVWRLIKSRVVSSFNQHVVGEMFEKDKVFNFNQINNVFNNWYHKHFVKIIIPEALKKLESDSIFKMGFMVRNLIENFLVLDLPLSYLEDVPLEEYYLPITNYTIDISKIESEEVENKVLREYLRWILRYNSLETSDDAKKFADENFFEEFDFVTEERRPLVDQTTKINVKELLDSIIKSPKQFDNGHILHASIREIPGLLTVNSQVSKLFQTRVNEVYLKQIDDLVMYQNIYINLIKPDELDSFL